MTAPNWLADARCTLDLEADADGWIVPECYHLGDRTRCWTFAPTRSECDAVQSWREHVADELGVCWSCGQPSIKDARPNRAGCERCWLMHHADQRIWPRDCPPFPGEATDG